MQHRFGRLAALALTATLAFALTGCESDDPFEEAGEEIDEAVDDAGDAIDDAADEMDD